MSTKAKDISYINWHLSRGTVGDFHSRGYRFLTDSFYPAVKRLESRKLTRADRSLLSEAWFRVGDMHDFNAAPKAAIRAYRKSLQYDPDDSEAHRELGNMCVCIGKYAEAVRYMKKALKLNPSDATTVDDFEWAQRELASSSLPLCRTGDWEWETCELLAQANFRKVLRNLKRRKSIQAMQYRACAYAGLQSAEDALEQWFRIANAKGSIRLYAIDWYFITDVVFDEPRFWESILACGNRFWHNDGIISYGQFWTQDSLEFVVFRNNKKIPWEAPENRRKTEERRSAYAKYQLARTRKDVDLAQNLSKKYPNWPEARKLAQKLQGKTKKRV